MPPCVYPFSQMEVKLCDLTWPHKSPKFNLHHLWKPSVGFKMAMLTLKLGILLLGYFRKNPNKGLKIYFSELPLQFPHALSSIPLQIPWFFWNSLFSNLVTHGFSLPVDTQKVKFHCSLLYLGFHFLLF